jgi:hypothetical protein
MAGRIWTWQYRGYQKVCVWGHNLEIEEND